MDESDTVSAVTVAVAVLGLSCLFLARKRLQSDWLVPVGVACVFVALCVCLPYWLVGWEGVMVVLIISYALSF